MAWKVWKCLEQDHPEIDGVDKALEIITLAGPARLEEVVRSVEIGSGEADLGNSSGQGQTPTVEAAQVGQ